MENKNQQRGLKPFVKGDARINRHGRPKHFDHFRQLAQKISHEDITLSNGQKISVIEAILRSWARSKEPMLQTRFIEIAYGKVPDRIDVKELTPNQTLILNYGHEREEFNRFRPNKFDDKLGDGGVVGSNNHG